MKSTINILTEEAKRLNESLNSFSENSKKNYAKKFKAVQKKYAEIVSAIEILEDKADTEIINKNFTYTVRFLKDEVSIYNKMETTIKNQKDECPSIWNTLGENKKSLLFAINALEKIK